MDKKLSYSRKGGHGFRFVSSISYVILLLGTLFATSSCMDESYTNVEQSKEKQVLLRMAIPGSNATLRSIDGTQENTINEVDVLAFKINGTSETFDYSARAFAASSSTPGAGTQYFTVTLQAVAYQQRFVLVTNAHAQVAALLGSSDWKGTDKQTMLSNLELSLPGGSDHWNATSSSNFTALPMWGESDAEIITPATTQLSNSINLIRMVARIDVQLDTTVAGLTGKFKLKSVDLYNTNTGGQIVPASANVTEENRNGVPYPYVTQPTIPTALQPYSARHFGPIVYQDFSAPGVTDVAMIGAMYTFEAAIDANRAQATCMVIGGVYGSDTKTTYYRVDFIAPDGATHLNVLRNYLYMLNITDVTGSGQPTSLDAFNARAANITANIVRWNQGGMGNIAFDGTNVLSVSKDTINLYRDALTESSTDNVLTVFTDYIAPAGGTSGWKIEKIVNAADTTQTATWLTVTPTSGSANVRTNTVLTCPQNTTGAPRSAIVWVAAGRLRYPVVVNQSIIPHISLDIVDGSGQPVTELTFGSDGSPSPQSFIVNWTPASDGVIQIESTPASATAFPTTDTGAPISGTLADASGTYTYSITPPAFTSDETTADPFLVKASEVEFTISNGITSITKSVTLKQIRYNIVVSAPQPYYSVTSGLNMLTVKSNTGWSVSSLTQTSHSGAALLSTDAVNNLKVGSNGDLLRFTPVNAPGNWGVVDFVISSTDTPERFTDIDTKLVIAAAPFKAYGISSAGYASLGYQADYYNIYPQNPASTGYDCFTMLNTAINYGTTATSKVIIPPFTITGVNIEASLSNARALTTTDISNATATNPDLIVISGSSTFGSDVATKLYTDVLQQGKTLFLFCEDGPSIQNMMNAIFDTQTPAITTATINNGTAAVYQLGNIANDPVLTNQFGDLRNAYWGCDGTAGSIGILNLPTSDIVTYSTGTNASGSSSGIPSGYTYDQAVTGFRHKTLNFIFMSDGGLLGPQDPNNPNSTNWPFVLNGTTKAPATKAYGSGTQQQISNSALMANMVTWVISNR